MTDPDLGAQKIASIHKSFEEYIQKSVDIEEEYWRQSVFDNPLGRPLVEKYLSNVSALRAHGAPLSLEFTTIYLDILKTKYREQLNELDAELAARERRLIKMLLVAIIENQRLIRFLRVEGWTDDLQTAVGQDRVNAAIRAYSQLRGDEGYLTNAPPLRFKSRGMFSELSKLQAQMIKRSVSDVKYTFILDLIKFYPRYLLDSARRNYIRLLVVLGLLGLGVDFIKEQTGLNVLGWGGVFTIAAGASALIFEKIWEHRSSNIHRNSMLAAVANLYLHFSNAWIMVARLNTLHNFVSDRTNREQTDAHWTKPH